MTHDRRHSREDRGRQSLGRQTRSRRINAVLCAALALAGLLLASPADAIRLKDVTHIKGIRENQLIGYGIVVGLDGTGDGSSSKFTAQSVANFLRRNNIRVNPNDMKLENTASVIVIADMPAFAQPGDRIDVSVNSIGDAESLQGGTLLMTPLYGGGSGVVYAVAQGAISLGGFGVSSGGTAVTKNHQTAGKIPGGALVEKASPVTFKDKDELHFILKNPDFTTAQRIAEVINFNQGAATAVALSAAEVLVRVPEKFQSQLTTFIAEIERLPVHPDQKARIVIDERTGTVVMGEGVRISTIALAHGSLTIQITQTNQISQPEGFSGGATTGFSNTGISVQEETRQLAVIEESVSLGELVQSLNAVGVTPRDLIAILQSIQSHGSLQAELIIR